MIKKFIRTLLAAVVFASACVRLQAALATYGFGPSGTPTASATFTDPNVTASTFSSGGPTTGSLIGSGGSPDSAFQGEQGWHVDAGSTLGGYFTFTVTANAGYQLDLSSLSLAVRTSSGPINFDLRSSVNSFGSVIANSAVTSSWVPAAIDLSGASFQNLSTVTFRIYGTGDNNNNNNSLFLVDNVVLDGLAPVPEPVHYALIGFAFVFVVVRFGRSRLGRVLA